MSLMALDPLTFDCILARTEEGIRKMRSRSPDVSPKLRSVLFLVDGSRSYGELLDRAGSFQDMLESQIQRLLELGLVETREAPPSGAKPARDPLATTPFRREAAAAPTDLSPIIAAKMQLLLRLEATGATDTDLFGSDLLEAKTLKELAQRAKNVSLRLREAIGAQAADAFWSQAKEILLAWRDLGTPRRGSAR